MRTATSLTKTSPKALFFYGFPVIALVFACFTLSPMMQAVTPPPDGGYPGENTAEGASALLHLNGGTYNTAVGFFSLGTLSTGQFCTGVGAGALLLNTADENTATGAGALLSDTVGFSNTANGAFALFSNVSGSNNTAISYQALYSNMDGFRNNAFGDSALSTHRTGSFNNAFGSLALASDESGASNNAFGDEALHFNADGNGNTAMGDLALQNNNGTGNCAFGAQALQSNTNGQDNNTAVGERSLANNTTGSLNIALGTYAGLGVSTASDVIVIGAAGAEVSDSCYIGNIWNQPGGSQAVYVNSDGKLGFQGSSRRFKDEIKTMAHASEVIYDLKPVSFRYKTEIDPTRPRGFGLIAEDVETVSADLVTRGYDGKPNSVRYDAVNTMLLNEFLKEHKKVEEQQTSIAELTSTVAKQEATIAEQQKLFESRLAEQEKRIALLASGLQKVSAQIEMGTVRHRTNRPWRTERRK